MGSKGEQEGQGEWSGCGCGISVRRNGSGLTWSGEM